MSFSFDQVFEWVRLNKCSTAQYQVRLLRTSVNAPYTVIGQMNPEIYTINAMLFAWMLGAHVLRDMTKGSLVQDLPMLMIMIVTCLCGLLGIAFDLMGFTFLCFVQVLMIGVYFVFDPLEGKENE